MHIRLLPGTFAAFIGIGGTGISMMLPDHQELIGACLIVVAIGILIFSIRFEDGHFLVGRPNPLRSGWWLFRHRRVPLQEAARLAYEAMERTGLDDMTAGGYSNVITPLDHFKYVILSTARRGLITIYGARAPSRQSLPIPPDLMSQLEPSRNDANGISSLSRASPIDFHDVWLSRRDLRRVISDRIRLLERVNRGLAQ